MNAKEYIESGAIEACITGIATEADWQELDQMAAQYPEVKAEKERLEMEMERQHLSMSVTPPPALRQSIFASMKFEKDHEEATVIEMSKPVEEVAPERPKVVPIVPTPKPVKWLQRALAVSVILLMGSVLLNFYFYAKSVTSKKEYDVLLVEQNSVLAKNEALQSSFEKLKGPQMKMVMMSATPAQPGSLATVYWDVSNKDVYLLINNLPKPAADKQYQLWAIVNGKPVDAGMVSQESDSSVIKMKNIPNADAFAITLEKKGGSASPTLEAMYVMGKV